MKLAVEAFSACVARTGAEMKTPGWVINSEAVSLSFISLSLLSISLLSLFLSLLVLPFFDLLPYSSYFQVFDSVVRLCFTQMSDVILHHLGDLEDVQVAAISSYCSF